MLHSRYLYMSTECFQSTRKHNSGELGSIASNMSQLQNDHLLRWTILPRSIEGDDCLFERSRCPQDWSSHQWTNWSKGDTRWRCTYLHQGQWRREAMEGGLQLRFPKLERSHENEKMTIIYGRMIFYTARNMYISTRIIMYTNSPHPIWFRVCYIYIHCHIAVVHLHT